MTLSEVTWDWSRTPRNCNEAVMGDIGLDSLHTTHASTLLDIMNKKCIERLIEAQPVLYYTSKTYSKFTISGSVRA